MSRGRLSSLDLIPEEGQDDIIWAMGELNQRKRTQADILFELNDRLAVKGIDGLSKSAFGRASVRAAVAARKIAERRAMFAGIAPHLTPENVDDGNLIIGEMIKTLITDILDAEAGVIAPKGAMELASAYVKAIQGQSISSDRKRKLEDDFKKKAINAVEKLSNVKGITQETREMFMRDLLGVRGDG
ncbi:hypothetical protein GCM10019059_34810 [Camelimonas fluminis]|uniref:Phage protein Gp27 family protein n=1 Tax=Camelimonas fluminis TaxID=1576911 RepID=A0ABV7UHC9_9HYPH|nr:phage protein Gp27 family protein [Camelimonas fluminis]GHE72237.1 hypothetical protein GCM10019059_34810 [Camelimonas fluminis]